MLCVPKMEAKCSKCGYLVPMHYKTWTMRSSVISHPVRVYLFACPKCGNRFRKVVKEEEVKK